MAQLNFDARTVVPDTGQQDPVPAGWYKVVMDKSEMKPTKDGTGMRLEMQFKVIDGQYTNRKIFEGLNLQNTNPVAQEIAYKQLSAVAHAVNVLMVEDSSQLHNIPLQIKVKLKPAQGQYDAGNSIVAYKNINELVSHTPAAVPGAPAAFGAGAPASFAPPPAAFAPPPVAAPAAGGWAPPAAQQPWASTAAAPVQAAPVQAAPVQAAPVQAAPVQAAPVQAAPVQAAPVQAAALAPPAWATAPAQAPAQAAAPVAAPGAGVTPPWATAPTA